ncbi:hypothetical protein M5K25_011936 [Dendrobium thyrsiflorum]|uniref:Uncharacterized protein n=1 Tax=Dendrobium thyrsiflorum TaxID=117978 RepID=A0ABD0V4G6_DENTH
MLEDLRLPWPAAVAAPELMRDCCMKERPAEMPAATLRRLFHVNDRPSLLSVSVIKCFGGLSQ